MKRKVKVLIFILIIVIVLSIGIFIGKNISDNSKKQSKLNYETQKIAVSSFIVCLNKNEKDTNIVSSDLKIDSKLLNTFIELINSSTIKNKIKKTYPNVKDIELKLIDNTEVIQAIYVCENYTEEECIDINNKYVSEFSKLIVQVYNISNIYVLDRANISERIVKK